MLSARVNVDLGRGDPVVLPQLSIRPVMGTEIERVADAGHTPGKRTFRAGGDLDLRGGGPIVLPQFAVRRDDTGPKEKEHLADDCEGAGDSNSTRRN